jgi:hypothetical protein
MNREDCFSLSRLQKSLIHTLKEWKMLLSTDKTVLPP